MQNKNKIIALTCAIALLGANITFATESVSPGSAGFANFGKTMENVSNMTDQANMMYKKAMQTASGMQMQVPKEEGKAPLSQFIKKELTTEEQAALKEMINYYLTTVKGILEKNKEATDVIKEKMTTLNKAFVEKITPYVDSTKLEEFKKFVETTGAKPFIMSNGLEPKKNIEKQKNDDKVKQEIKKQEIKKFLSQKTRDLFNKKLDQIPAEKQLEFYNKLITKIDLLLSKSQAEKTKGMLQELKMITQEKIDSMSQSGEEQETINELLDEGEDSNSSSGETN